MSQPGIIVAQMLGFGLLRRKIGLRLHEARKSLEAVEQNPDHDRGDERNIESDRDENRVIEPKIIDEIWPGNDKGHEEGGLWQVHQAEDAADHGYRDEQRDMPMLERSAISIELE